MAYRDTVLADSPTVYFEYNADNLATNSGSRTGVSVNSSGGITWGTGLSGLGRAPIYAGPSQATRVNYNLNTHNIFNGTAWTFEAWFKRGTQDNHMDIVNTFDANNELAVYQWAPGATADDRKIKVHHKGSGGVRQVISGPAITDTNWHHVAVVGSGTTVTLYVDGVASGSVTRQTYNFVSTTPFRLGAYGDAANNENWNGQIDEVGLYTTALTPTRISAHYADGTGINAGYTAQPMTASADAPSGTTAMGNVRSIAITEDAATSATFPTTPQGGQTYLAAGRPWYFGLPSTTLNAGEFIQSAVLYLTPMQTDSTARTISIGRITGVWAESTVTQDNAPAFTSVGTTSKTFTANTEMSINITDVLAQANTGVRIYSTSTPDVNSSEAATANYRPRVVYTIATPASVDVPVLPMTGSSTMVDATISTSIGVSIAAQGMNASSAMVDGVATTETNILAAPMEASALMGEGATGTVLSAEAMTANAEFVMPLVIPSENVYLTAPVLEASATWLDDIRVNGLSLGLDNDTYFARITAQDPQVWFRLRESGGNDLINSGDAYPDSPVQGYAFNVSLGQNNAPGGRRSAFFNGNAYIKQMEKGRRYSIGSDDNPDDRGSAMQFSIRTTKKNSFLMSSHENPESDSNNLYEYQIELVNGHLRFTYVTQKPAYEGSGFVFNVVEGTTDIADGNWHTIHIYRQSGVVVPYYASLLTMQGVYIDGKLEFNKIVQGTSSSSPSATPGIWTGYFPDFIGGNTNIDNNYYDGALPRPADSAWFVGDLSEIVVFNPTGPFTDNGRSQFLDYNAFNGWTPFLAEPATASATSGKHRGKGNKKRALYLTGFEDFSQWGQFRPNDGVDQFSGRNVAYEAKDRDVDEQVYDIEEYTTGRHYFDNGGFPRAFGPVQTFRAGILGQPWQIVDSAGAINGVNTYFDSVTGLPRLIDIFKDVDLEEYDIIMIDGWPNDSDEYSLIDSRYGEGAMEKFSNDLLDAAAAGKHLMVTHPQMALSLGIAEDIEFARSLQEWRWTFETNTHGDIVETGFPYDYGSAVKFPWNISADYRRRDDAATVAAADYLDKKALYYGDSNSNNKFRVVSLIDGLTTIPSFVVTDAVSHGGDPTRRGFKYADRTNGLRIGDEFFFHGASKGTELYEENIFAQETGLPRGLPYWPAARLGQAEIDEFDKGEYTEPGDFRYFGAWAIPSNKLVAGTVVTTFGANMWNGKSIVENPYRNYATTVVLRPGDVIKGRTLAGKIFVNFSEVPVGVPVMVPRQYGVGLDGETAAQREWDWSFARANPTGAGIGIEWLTNYGMVARGLEWLALDAPVVEEGDVVISAEPMVASAETRTPAQTSEKSVTVVAGAALAITQLVNAQGYSSDEAVNVVLPMTATATITGFGRNYSAEPMRASATLVVNSSIIATDTEQVVLYLHDAKATVFLKEES